jgi:small GTP-binding protein
MIDVSKVIIVGDEAVGKTKLADFLRSAPFDYKYKPTKRVDVFSLNIKNHPINVFDCGGTDKNLLYASQDWIDASVAILVFDLSTKSWKNIFAWVNHLKIIIGDETPVIIVGTKSDLPSLFIDKGMIARGLFALRRNGKIVRYIETSSKTGQNCDHLVHLLSEYI